MGKLRSGASSQESPGDKPALPPLRSEEPQLCRRRREKKRKPTLDKLREQAGNPAIRNRKPVPCEPKHHGNGAGTRTGSASLEGGPHLLESANGNVIFAFAPPRKNESVLDRSRQHSPVVLERRVPSDMQSSSTRKMGIMTDVHRRFLQLLMTHGVLEEWEIKRLQKHCYRVHDRNATVEKLEDFINNINSVLESLYIEIKKGFTEDDGRPIYALVNLATTSISKMATDFAENELDLFRKALELIIDSETGFASSTNILNLVDQLKGKKMRKKEAEQVLQKFVQNKWLIEKEGEFTLHTRAILEMEQYIRETYPDAVKICNICHSLLIQSFLFQGQSCETCGIKMHLPCVAKYFQSNSEPRCPHCNDYWPHDIPEVFNPEKEREAGTSKSSKKSLRSRHH
ncbi:non-structural maintenance of chromosomes element 1 homolog isoform X3 [Nycticebus coucang]|uniref:non-structural maintenance of chromosomes element 1 homolog isoform X3 n=1 Tax=Nycticebus coucang TaxID=9470 RepID=UPI00234DE399|nr:non-structural maintenance of chromosomes element 1 homolog isoform X3 [Nycticebus coucang]